jgi:hypothetical protein
MGTAGLTKIMHHQHSLDIGACPSKQHHTVSVSPPSGVSVVPVM